MNYINALESGSFTLIGSLQVKMHYLKLSDLIAFTVFSFLQIFLAAYLCLFSTI